MSIPCAATTPPCTLPCPALTAIDQHVWISTHKTNLSIALLVLKSLAGSSQPPSTQQVPFSRTGPFQPPVAELTQPLRLDRDADLVGKTAPTILAAAVARRSALGCPSPSGLSPALQLGHPWDGSCHGAPVVPTILTGGCAKARSPAPPSPAR